MPPRLNRHPGHLLDHLQYTKGLAKSTIKVSNEAFNQFVLKGIEEDFLCYQFICNRSPVY